MELKLIRKEFTANSTIGELSINGKFFCYTLEDVVRDNGIKVDKKTAIPYGKYQVIINMSPAFKHEMPLLLNVPGFEGIRMHKGNTAADTEGCIIVGMHKEIDKVYDCQAVYDGLMIQLKKAFFNEEKAFITITKEATA